MMDNEALHKAVKRADLAGIRALLATGVSANTLDSSGLPPLAFVLVHNYCVGFVISDDMIEMIRMLRAAGADPHLNGVGKNLVDEAHESATSSIESADASRLADLLFQA